MPRGHPHIGNRALCRDSPSPRPPLARGRGRTPGKAGSPLRPPTMKAGRRPGGRHTAEVPTHAPTTSRAVPHRAQPCRIATTAGLHSPRITRRPTIRPRTGRRLTTRPHTPPEAAPRLAEATPPEAATPLAAGATTTDLLLPLSIPFTRGGRCPPLNFFARCRYLGMGAPPPSRRCVSLRSTPLLFPRWRIACARAKPGARRLLGSLLTHPYIEGALSQAGRGPAPSACGLRCGRSESGFEQCPLLALAFKGGTLPPPMRLASLCSTRLHPPRLRSRSSRSESGLARLRIPRRASSLRPEKASCGMLLPWTTRRNPCGFAL
jgi:hypothetical protein